MELLETIQFSLLRLASALCVPLALFTVITTARRPDIYERYAWGVFSLGLLAGIVEVGKQISCVHGLTYVFKQQV